MPSLLDLTPGVVWCTCLSFPMCWDYRHQLMCPGSFNFLRNYQTLLNTGWAISLPLTVFKGCDFSLTLPTLVNLHVLDNSLSSVCEGVCRGFSLNGHNDYDTDHVFMCLFSICMYYWPSVCMSLCMTLSMSFSLDGHNDNDIIHLLCACFSFVCLIGRVCVQLFLHFLIWLFCCWFIQITHCG